MSLLLVGSYDASETAAASATRGLPFKIEDVLSGVECRNGIDL